MKPMPKWLLIPPAVALLLVLGPLSMQGGGAPRSPAAAPEAAPTATPEPGADLGRPTTRTPLTPRTPDLWQMSSALVGVLLLGIGAVLVLRRLRGGATPTRTATLATLRQTLRLSTRQSLHAIEFDDRILLVGEHERGLVLLDSGKLPERAADEAEVLARHAQAAAAHPAEADEGAVPRNLVIPRPEAGPSRRLPTPPGTPARGNANLNDFRTLLQKAGRA